MSKSTESPGLLTIAEREARILAPYAMHSIDSRGRRFEEPEHAYRGPFQRDRDRILHSAAFRRLSGKMQVFTKERGDYHRTRLTHTQEVASIARTIGRALQLNEDLVEALALVHDIGHPPFGHAGEDALNQCLANEGGFSHNQFALTLVEQLEQRHFAFPGLNLTWEVLDGQASRWNKHDTQTDEPAATRLLEVQVVDLADSITYDAHDTDDAVKLGLVSLAELESLDLIAETLQIVRARHAELSGSVLRRAIVHGLIDRQVSDVLSHGAEMLVRSGLKSAAEACQSGCQLNPSPRMAARKQQLEEFLYERVYRHPELIQVRTAAQQRLSALFDHYVARPERLPTKFQLRARDIGVRRAVGDYLAGMTDRFCDAQYRQLTGKT